MPKNAFAQALRALPACASGNFDPLGHTTIEDLVFITQHEVDLYNEGEETDIKTKRDLNSCKNYIKKYGN